MQIFNIRHKSPQINSNHAKWIKTIVRNVDPCKTMGPVQISVHTITITVNVVCLKPETICVMSCHDSALSSSFLCEQIVSSFFFFLLLVLLVLSPLLCFDINLNLITPNRGDRIYNKTL